MTSFIIADDEEYARLRIRTMMQSHLDFRCVAECSSGVEALEKIRNLKPQLVFIDISMPGKSGLEVAEAFRGEKILFIFITAYNEFALRSFESNTLDYLVKPVSPERLAQALMKTKFRMESDSNYVDLVTSQKTIRLEISKISHIRSEDGFCQIHYESQIFYSDLSLEDWLQRLSQFGFIRTHKSFVINKIFFHGLYRLADRKYEIELKNNSKSRIRVGRSFLNELKMYFPF